MEEVVVFESGIYAVGHKHRIAPVLSQKCVGLYVVENAVTDALNALVCGIYLFERCPTILYFLNAFRRKSCGKGFESCIDLLLAVEPLLRISSLVLKIKNHTIIDSLFVKIGMDKLAEANLTGTLKSLVTVFFIIF